MRAARVVPFDHGTAATLMRPTLGARIEGTQRSPSIDCQTEADQACPSTGFAERTLSIRIGIRDACLVIIC